MILTMVIASGQREWRRAAKHSVRIAGLVFIAFALAGCGSSSEQVRPTCDDLSLPRDEVIACRLQQNSFDGRFGRQLSDRDIQTIVHNINEFSRIQQSLEEGTISQEQAAAEIDTIDAQCQQLANMGCVDILLTPWKSQ